MEKTFLKLIYFILALSLSACGQTGPLYLPDQKPPVYVPHHSPQSAH
ncbi:MAG: lipoprotein [Rickettsiella sp.]|nr:lipoprotein [Rickettsiella sp.]